MRRIEKMGTRQIEKRRGKRQGWEIESRVKQFFIIYIYIYIYLERER